MPEVKRRRDERIKVVRRSLDRARAAMGPETRRLLETAKANANGRKGQVIDELEQLDGAIELRLPSEVYLHQAVEQLTDLVEELT